MRNLSLFNTQVAPANDTAVEGAASSATQDVIIDAIAVYNSHSGAVAYTISVGTTLANSKIIATASPAAGATANCIDGFQLVLTGGQKVFCKDGTGAKLIFHVMGKKASKGNIAGRAVLGS